MAGRLATYGPALVMTVLVVAFVGLAGLWPRDGEAVAVFFPRSFSEKEMLDALHASDARVISLGGRKGQAVIIGDTDGIVDRLYKHGAWLALSAKGAAGCGAIKQFRSS